MRNAIWAFFLLSLLAQAATVQNGPGKLGAIEHADGPMLHIPSNHGPSHVQSWHRNRGGEISPPEETKNRTARRLLAQNVTPEQPLLETKAKHAALTTENQRLRRDQAQMRNALAHLLTRLTAARAAHRQLAHTRAMLRDLIPRRQALEDQHQTLLSRLVALESDLELLRLEHNTHRSDANRDWAVLAIGVLLGGALSGLLVTRTRC